MRKAAKLAELAEVAVLGGTSAEREVVVPTLNAENAITMGHSRLWWDGEEMRVGPFAPPRFSLPGFACSHASRPQSL